MKKAFAILLISALLFVGCTEKVANEPVKTPVENQPGSKPVVKSTASGESQVDTAMQDDLTQLASEMAEVESLMNDLQQLQNISFDL